MPAGLEPSQRQVVLAFSRDSSRLSEGTMKFRQFAALPYRMRDDAVEILLITTRKKGRWSVPKGWPVKHCSPQETAAVEAYEEGGVRGTVGTKRIGQFRKRRIRKKRPVFATSKSSPSKLRVSSLTGPKGRKDAASGFVPEKHHDW